MNRYFITLILLLCLNTRCNWFAPSCTPNQVAALWADRTLHVTRWTPANSPTFASRALAYIGLTMYESVVHGATDHQSMAGQLNGLDSLPLPETGANYNWVLSLNAAQASIIKQIYQQTSEANKYSVDSLEHLIYRQLATREKDKSVVTRSVAYGKAIAAAIFEWSLTDGGHRGYLKNFDKTFKSPHFEGSWRPPLYAQSFSHHPLHPYWGQNRTFLLKNAQIPLPKMIPHDTMPSSPCYKQFMEVYEKEKVLTMDEKEAALWWGDDPADTFTPPGHSYYLATTALKMTNPPLIIWAETYARTGLAVGDAFIDCWKWKYHFFSERPNAYITQFIDPAWESFWPDPPFPAFPSGHAIQAAAAASVLTDMFGENFSFTDYAHKDRPRDELRQVAFKPRTFRSFWAFAEETANSRFYGGIHTRQDNQAGQEAGAIIGKNINELQWQKTIVK